MANAGGIWMSAAMLALAGSISLAGRDSSAQGFTSRSALVLLGAAAVAVGCTSGPFWALHHSVQPLAHRATSIAFINSLANLGGFVGPYVVGSVHDALGPSCPILESSADGNEGADAEDAADGGGEEVGCMSQWGWATVVLAVACACLATAAWLAVRRLKRRDAASGKQTSSRVAPSSSAPDAARFDSL